MVTKIIETKALKNWDLKIGLEIIQFSIKTRNTVTWALSIRLTRLDINIHENDWGFNRWVIKRNDLQWDVLNRLKKVTMFWIIFAVNEFCTYCSSLEGKLSNYLDLNDEIEMYNCFYNQRQSRKFRQVRLTCCAVDDP